MRRLFLPAWVAGILAVTAYGARAQDAGCDLMCRFQSYISTDHMAAQPNGAGSATAPRAAKHRAHAAKAHAAPVKPASSVAAIAASKPAKPITEAKAPRKTITTTKTDVISKHENVAAAARRPKHHAVAESVPKPPPSAEATLGPVAVADVPQVMATASRSRRVPRAARRIAKRSPPKAPLATVALIPGSARLVPAEFQRFGKL